MKKAIVDLMHIDRLVRELLTDSAVGFVVLALLVTAASLVMHYDQYYINNLPDGISRKIEARPRFIPSAMLINAVAKPQTIKNTRLLTATAREDLIVPDTSQAHTVVSAPDIDEESYDDTLVDGFYEESRDEEVRTREEKDDPEDKVKDHTRS